MIYIYIYMYNIFISDLASGWLNLLRLCWLNPLFLLFKSFILADWWYWCPVPILIGFNTALSPVSTPKKFNGFNLNPMCSCFQSHEFSSFKANSLPQAGPTTAGLASAASSTTDLRRGSPGLLGWPSSSAHHKIWGVIDRYITYKPDTSEQYPKIGLDLFSYMGVSNIVYRMSKGTLRSSSRSSFPKWRWHGETHIGSEMPVVSGEFQAFGVHIQCRNSLTTVRSECRL